MAGLGGLSRESVAIENQIELSERTSQSRCLVSVFQNAKSTVSTVLFDMK